MTNGGLAEASASRRAPEPYLELPDFELAPMSGPPAMAANDEPTNALRGIFIGQRLLKKLPDASI